jgi:hypothetical protein
VNCDKVVPNNVCMIRDCVLIFRCVYLEELVWITGTHSYRVQFPLDFFLFGCVYILVHVQMYIVLQASCLCKQFADSILL